MNNRCRDFNRIFRLRVLVNGGVGVRGSKNVFSSVSLGDRLAQLVREEEYPDELEVSLICFLLLE